MCRRHESEMTRPQTITCRSCTTLEGLTLDAPVSRTVETNSTLHTLASHHLRALRIFPITFTSAKQLTHLTRTVHEFTPRARIRVQVASLSQPATVPESHQVWCLRHYVGGFVHWRVTCHIERRRHTGSRICSMSQQCNLGGCDSQPRTQADCWIH